MCSSPNKQVRKDFAPYDLLRSEDLDSFAFINAVPRLFLIMRNNLGTHGGVVVHQRLYYSRRDEDEYSV